MDPPIINETSFSTANPSSYTLTGIWPFSSINGGGGKIEGLELKMETLINRIGEREDSTVTEYSRRKRSDVNFEDESSKIVSTSSYNDLVISIFKFGYC